MLKRIKLSIEYKSATFYQQCRSEVSKDEILVTRVYMFLDKEPSLPYYLPIAGARIVNFIPFLRVLVQYEMQTTSSMPIFYDNNHYIKSAFNSKRHFSVGRSMTNVNV